LEKQTIIDRQELLEALRLHSDGNRKKAEALYRKIIGVDPNLPESLHVLGGLAHCVDENDTAIELLDYAIALTPDRSHYYHTLGDVYKKQGKLNNALQCFQKALDLNQEAVDTLISLGQTYHLAGRLADAESCYQRALKLNPGNSSGLVGLGNIFKEQGFTKEAESFYERFLKISPNYGVEIKSALLLPVIDESNESIGRYRRRILEKIESLKIKNMPVADPYKQVGVTNFLLAYHGFNNKELLEKIASFYLQICPDLSWTSPHCYRSRQTDGRITIGIVSCYLRKHTIGYLNYGIIQHLNREKFSIKLFRLGGEVDSLSEAIQRAADEVIPLPDDLREARRTIADQAVDLLFYPDIGMEPFTYFLAYSRLAPVQCTTWGHADTTGIPNMDYFLSSLYAEPPDSSAHYSEQLILLKRFAMYCYLPELPADVSLPANDGLVEKGNLYVCPQSLFKFHPDFDAIISAILKRDPNGVLLLFNGKHASWTRLLQDRFQSTIPEVAERIRFHPRVPADEFLAILNRADVILDPFHFGGGYTSLLCLACGLPVVTLPGAFMRGRMTYALYKQMGLMDCVATDRLSFVDLALKLANNKSWNHKIRNQIRERAPALFEDIEAVHELERFFEWSVNRNSQAPALV
jgi:predicted O-linked N-acetylglucosamine transferase (SPINDLY family)